MRDYAKVRPQFWTGETGRKLRALGGLDMLVGLYLITGPHANWIGLYYLPIQYIAHDVGCSIEEATKALRRVCDAGFATYDGASEHIWVHEGAREQIDEELKPGDKRCLGIAKDLKHYGKLALSRRFHERYANAFHLPDAESLGLSRSPFEAPLKPEPLRSQKQEQDQKQDLSRAEPEGSGVAPLVLEPQRAAKEPLPFTIAELLAELEAGSGGLATSRPFDNRMAPSITLVIRQCAKESVTLADVRLAGEYIAARWGEGREVGPKWVATAGNLLDVVGKATRWNDAGRPDREGGASRAPSGGTSWMSNLGGTRRTS